MTWRDFPAAEPAVEEGFSQALEEAPPGKPPAPATLPLRSFLGGLGLALLGVLGLHLALSVTRLAGPPRYALEAVAMIGVGAVLLRWWKRLAQEGRAVDAKGNPVGGDAVLGAYRQFVFGDSYKAFGPATSVGGDGAPPALRSGPAADLAARSLVTVGRTAACLVLYRYDESVRRLLRAGVGLAEVRGVEAAGDGARVRLASGTLLLGGVDAEELRVFLAAGSVNESAGRPPAPAAA
ncbi:MAG TPA: hypothetical protein VG389_07140 [Myxococcota bacterium]|nr:hypothetical protein [Myxococcota bacterium]